MRYKRKKEILFFYRMSATLLHGDCLEVMKTLPDASVDCFVCDLPYGCLSGGNKQTERKGGAFPEEGCSWDVKIDLAAFWVEVKRLCKSDNTPILMFCNTRFGIDLINSNPTWFRYDLVWDKQRGVNFLAANKRPMTSHEMIYVFGKKTPFYKRVDVKTDKKEWVRDNKPRKGTEKAYSPQYGVNFIDYQSGGKDGMRCPLSVIDIPGKSKRNGHPTEKPEVLYRWLLERYVPEGGTVLDPTAGSFNCVWVAEEMGLRGIGIEKDEKFYKKALERKTPTQPTIELV